ncbi:hypothetical protein ABT093_37955 [Kitasatospora sp. NPDC002551]|uniref:hypothetical protein n=1 Tax=Kitasatospora sp. NPDC002551 TaxID=3154539 RepID=UPI00332F9E1C
MTTPDWDDDLAGLLQRLAAYTAPTTPVPPEPTAPPMPSTPPTVPPQAPTGQASAVPITGPEWWRKAGPTPVHTPIPLGAAPGDQGAARPSMEAAAAAFWAPVGRIMSEQFHHIASEVGQQVGQLLTETEAQRWAREQVEYEALRDSQRALRDAQFAAAGETPEQKARRHADEAASERGHQRHDLVGLVDLLADRIGETPDERAQRRRAEHELQRQRARAQEDAVLAARGERPEDRARRHRQQQLADRREAQARARRQRRRAARVAGPTDRTSRFRRWCTLTAISAIGGYAIGLVPLLAPGGPWVGGLIAFFGWALDLLTRDLGRLRVSEVRGPAPLALLVLLRVPVASGLAVALGVGGLFPSLHLFS